MSTRITTVVANLLVMPNRAQRTSSNRTVTATEAKSRLGALMQWAVANRNEVIIESNGAPKVVLVPYELYGELEQLKAFKKRAEARERIRTLKAQVSTRNSDLSAKEAYRLSGVSSSVIHEMLVEKQ
jgi:prevent-host-death family protein